MNPIRKTLLAFLVLLPVLGLGLVIAGNEGDIAKAKLCRVKITGYDPRSLLYGRYILFRFDKQETPEAETCLAAVANKKTSYRYFMNEQDAPEAEKLLRDQSKKVTLDLRVTPTGRALFGTLYIDEKPWQGKTKE